MIKPPRSKYFIAYLIAVFIFTTLSCSKAYYNRRSYEIKKIDGEEWIALDSCVITDNLITDLLKSKIIPYLKAINASPQYNFLTIRIEKQFLQISCERKRKFEISRETISYYNKIGFSEVQDFFILILLDKGSCIESSGDYDWVKYTTRSPEKDPDVIDDSIMYWQYYIYPDSLEFISEFCPPAEDGFDEEAFYKDKQHLDRLEIRLDNCKY